MAKYVRIFEYEMGNFWLYDETPDRRDQPFPYTSTTHRAVRTAARAARKMGYIPWSADEVVAGVIYYY